MEELTTMILEAAFQDELESNTELKKQPKRIRKLRPGVCQYCNKWFADGRHLYAHIRIHTGEKPFVCNVCHKGFNQSSNLRRHQEVHTERKPLNCDICERQFIDKLHFNQHVLAHTGAKPYSCPICHKKYAFKSSLIRHKLKHGKFKKNRFFCSICQEGFVYEQLLKYHMRIHNTDIKSYECTLCKRVFSRRIRYHSHLMSIHNIKVALQCKICKERFIDEKAYEKHYFSHKEDQEQGTPQQNEANRTESDKNVENDTVKKKFLSEIYKDIKIAFQCKDCNERFPDKQSLGKHYLYHKHNKESVVLLQKETNITESDSEIEYDSMIKGTLSKISSATKKEVEIITDIEQNFDNITQNKDPCEFPSGSQDEIETEPEQHFENDITENELICEVSKSSQEEFEIKTEPDQYFNNIKNRYICGVCYEEFSYITSIQEHLRTHTMQCIFMCYKCKKYFNSKSLLKEHTCSTNTEIEILDCYICEEKFSSRDDLKEHLITHTKEDTYF